MRRPHFTGGIFLLGTLIAFIGSPLSAEDVPYVGVYTRSNSNVLDSRNAFPGLTVTSVVENSPAEAVGLKTGDVILEANGKELFDPEQLEALVEAQPVGGVIPIKYERNRTILEADLVSVKRLKPKSGSGGKVWVEKTKLGMKFREASEDQITEHELEPGQGLEIIEIAENGPLADEGIDPGSIIISVNDIPVFSPSNLLEQLDAMEQSERVEIGYISPNGRDRSKEVSFFAPDQETKKIFFPPFVILDKTGTTSELSIPILLFKREKLAGATKWRFLYFIRFETGEADELLEIDE